MNPLETDPTTSERDARLLALQRQLEEQVTVKFGLPQHELNGLVKHLDSLEDCLFDRVTKHCVAMTLIDRQRFTRFDIRTRCRALAYFLSQSYEILAEEGEFDEHEHNKL